MIDVSLARIDSGTSFAFDGSADCPLWKLCESLADEFVRACLNADNPFQVRSKMERQICTTLDFEPSRAEALFELALEVLHLRSEGCYQSEVTVIAYLITVASGGAESLGDS